MKRNGALSNYGFIRFHHKIKSIGERSGENYWEVYSREMKKSRHADQRRRINKAAALEARKAQNERTLALVVDEVGKEKE
jgi:hypothetical protein